MARYRFLIQRLRVAHVEIEADSLEDAELKARARAEKMPDCDLPVILWNDTVALKGTCQVFHDREDSGARNALEAVDRWLAGKYRKVAYINTTSVAEAFELSQNIDKDWTYNDEVVWSAANGLRSTMVGDIVLFRDHAFLVRPHGFLPLSFVTITLGDGVNYKGERWEVKMVKTEAESAILEDRDDRGPAFNLYTLLARNADRPPELVYGYQIEKGEEAHESA